MAAHSDGAPNRLNGSNDGAEAWSLPVVQPLKISRSGRKSDEASQSRASDIIGVSKPFAIVTQAADKPDKTGPKPEPPSRRTEFNLTSTLQLIANSDSSSAQAILAPIQLLIGSLDALSQVHPFLAVALLPFKAVVTLELKRRENDRRILALIAQMADVMSCLKDLPRRSVQSQEESTLEDILIAIQVSRGKRSSYSFLK